MRRPLLLLLFLIAAALLLVGAGPVAAATAESDDGGLLFRAGGDATVAPDDEVAAVLVMDGDVDIAGSADVVVVIEGTARLDGATVDELIVVSGNAILGPGTTVTGDVRLVDSTIEQSPSATVDGIVDTDASFPLARGLWVLSALMLAGWAALVLLAGLALAAVAPKLSRRAGRTITAEVGRSALAGLVLWVAVPILAVLAFATVIGIPVALTVLVIVLPLLAFVGLLVGAVRIGEYLTSGGTGHGHPYLAVTVGAALLVVVGLIPFLGPLALTVVSFLGSGALVLHAVQAARSESRPEESQPEESQPEESRPEESEPEPAPVP